MSDIVPGYMGVLEVAGIRCRCNSFNVNPSQPPLFFNHVFGLNDTGSGSDSKFESVGSPVIQRKIMRPGTIQISGGFSLYPDTATGAPLFDEAVSGDYFDISMAYSCNDSRSYNKCRVNSYTMSVTAGDIVNITCDLLVLGTMSQGGGGDTLEDTRKLITWDQFNVSGDGITGDIKGFNLSINNNAKYVYTNGKGYNGEDMGAYDMRLGVQEVSGSVLVYGDRNTKFIDEVTDTAAIGISFPGFNATINCVIEPVKIDASIGPVIATIPFTGVDRALT